MRKDTISYGISNVKWAPETFGCSVYGKRLVLNDPSHFGCLLIAGKRKELEDEIKRIYRKGLKKTNFVTIGFRSADDPRRYFFTSQLQARADDLPGRLRVFKEWKRHCLESGCVLTTIEVTEGELVPGKTNGGGLTRTISERVDLKKPLTIRFV